MAVPKKSAPGAKKAAAASKLAAVAAAQQAAAQPVPAALEDVISILDDAQESKSTHARCLERLATAKKRAGDAFTPYFLDKVNRVLVIGKKEPAVDRLVDLFANFVCFDGGAGGKRDKKREIDRAFVDDVLRHLLGLSMAKNNAVRFRVCEIVGGIVHRLKEAGFALSDDVSRLISEQLTPRLEDVNASVRAAALRAFAPYLLNGESNAFAGLQKRAVSMIESDPQKEVRKAAIAALHIEDKHKASFANYELVAKRAMMDKDDNVRVAAYARLAQHRAHAMLSSDSYVALVHAGSQDKAPAVRKAFTQAVLSWHRIQVDGTRDDDDLPVYELLNHMFAGPSSKREEAEKAAEVLARVVVADSRFEARMPEGARAALKPSGAVVWRQMCERAIEREESGEASEEELLAVPTLSELAALLPLYFAAAASGDHNSTIVARQLLALAGRLDFADEAGRSRMHSALTELVREPRAPLALLETVLETLMKASPTRDAFVSAMCEACSELAATPAEEGANARQNALTVAAFVLKHATGMTPALRGLVEGDGALVPAVVRDEVASPEERAAACRALGLFCTVSPHDSESAVAWMPILAAVLAFERERAPAAFVAALECVFDAALMFGFEKFAECAVTEEQQAAGGLGAWLRAFLVDLLEGAATPDEARVASEGVAKLLTLDRIPAAEVPALLSRVLLRALSAAKEERVKTCLGHFLRAYAFAPSVALADRRVRLIEAAVPDVLWTLALAPAGCPLADVKPDMAADVILYLTDQRPLPALQDTATMGSTAHERIARAALRDTLADEEGATGRGAFAKLAGKLAAMHAGSWLGKDADVLTEVKYFAACLEGEAEERVAKALYKKLVDAAKAAKARADDGNPETITDLTRRLNEEVDERRRELPAQRERARELASRYAEHGARSSDGQGEEAPARPKRAPRPAAKGKAKGAAAPAAAAPARGGRRKVVVSSSSTSEEEEQSDTSEEEELVLRKPAPAARAPAARASKAAAAERLRSANKPAGHPEGDEGSEIGSGSEDSDEEEPQEKAAPRGSKGSVKAPVPLQESEGEEESSDD